MGRAWIRFYQELNRFLPEERRGRTLPVPLIGSPGVKDLIESFGVPHTEVDLVVVDGVSVGFDYNVLDGDRIAVYPVFESIDISETTRVRPAGLRRTRFILDVHLGALARLLRLLGFDAWYRRDYEDAEIVEEAARTGRIILTRDQGLLMRRAVTHGYWLRSQDPVRQAAEVVRRFDLAERVAPFTRCPRCNGLLEWVRKESVRRRLEAGTYEHYDTFYQCSSCGQVYWRGSHYEALAARIEAILSG
jgi:hypothetical protein